MSSPSERPTGSRTTSQGPTWRHRVQEDAHVADSGAGAVRLHRTTSPDGTSIGYLSHGSGPSVVLVQGAMGTAGDFSELAQALAHRFSVHSIDRRGRGHSPKPYDSGHDIARDVQDVDAVLQATGASSVFGLSSGAVIALEAAKTLPRVARAILYEPPFYPGGICRDGVARLYAQLERGDLAAALVTSLRTAGTAPAPLRVLPFPVARLLAGAVLALDARAPGGRARLGELLPGIRYDFNVVAGRDAQMASYAAVDKPVLLLGGTRSPSFLARSVRDLEQVLPRATRVELAGLSHSGPWNASRGGRPRVVAQAVESFLA